MAFQAHEQMFNMKIHREKHKPKMMLAGTGHTVAQNTQFA